MKILLFAKQPCASSSITRVNRALVEFWKRIKKMEYDDHSVAWFHVARRIFDLLGIGIFCSKIKSLGDIAGWAKALGSSWDSGERRKSLYWIV